MTERFAIYFAPARDSALWGAAARWLGRDAASGMRGAAGGGQNSDEIFALSQSARRYGFHATIKAPMALAEGRGREELEAALAAFAARTAPVVIESLVLRSLGGFLALVPAAQGAALTDFAQAVVEAFEPFRAPMSAKDRDRRLKGGLTDRQVGYLDRFGYPYVGDEFRFHMTLTDRLPAEAAERVMAQARAYFAPFTERPLAVDRLALFHEPAGGGDFIRLGDFALRG